LQLLPPLIIAHYLVRDNTKPHIQREAYYARSTYKGSRGFTAYGLRNRHACKFQVCEDRASLLQAAWPDQVQMVRGNRLDRKNQPKTIPVGRASWRPALAGAGTHVPCQGEWKNISTFAQMGSFSSLYRESVGDFPPRWGISPQPVAYTGDILQNRRTIIPL